MIYLDQSQSETENLIQIRITFDTRFESALIFSLKGIDDRNIKWYILSRLINLWQRFTFIHGILRCYWVCTWCCRFQFGTLCVVGIPYPNKTEIRKCLKAPYPPFSDSLQRWKSLSPRIKLWFSLLQNSNCGVHPLLLNDNSNTLSLASLRCWRLRRFLELLYCSQLYNKYWVTVIKLSRFKIKYPL